MSRRWALVRLRLRSEVRRRPGGFVLLIVAIAISGGVAMAAAAGARRSETSYDRFRSWAHDTDVSFAGCDCSPAEFTRALDRLAAAPFVLDSTRVALVDLAVRLPDGTTAAPFSAVPVVDLQARLGRDLPRVKLLHGRLPDPTRPFEATIGFVVAERYGLHVGDAVHLVAQPGAVRPAVPEAIRIVGIHAAPGGFPSASGPTRSYLVLTPAFARAFPDLVLPADNSLNVRLRPGADRDEVAAFTDSLGVGIDVSESSSVTSGIDRTIRVETVALVLIAAVVAVVGLVVVSQMLRRQSVPGDLERTTYAALGSDRGDAIRVGLLRGACIGCAGAALAVIVAIAMSPLLPVGIGRIADPDVGWHADVAVIGIGASLTLLVVAAVGVLTAALEERRARRAQVRGSARPLWPVPGGRPSTLVGVHFAHAGRAGSRSPSARASVVSLVLVAVVLTGTVVTVESFGHLVDRRDLAGATWDAAVLPAGNDDGHYDVPAALAKLRAVPGVKDVTTSGWATPGGLYVNGVPVDTQIFGDDGPIKPAISHGRAPGAAGQIALGARTRAALHVKVGDEVRLALKPGGPSMRGRIVGEAVLSSPAFFDVVPGTGAAVVTSTFTALGERDVDAGPFLLLRYTPRREPQAALSAAIVALRSGFAFEATDRQGVTGLGRIRLLPMLLLAGLLALGAAAITHVLLVSVTSHRRDVAVLRAIGFTRGQSGVAVMVHATFLATVACAVGIPIGLLLGRIAWAQIAASLYVVPRPIVPALLVALLAVLLAGVANLASILPAMRAMRLEPATILHTD